MMESAAVKAGILLLETDGPSAASRGEDDQTEGPAAFRSAPRRNRPLGFIRNLNGRRNAMSNRNDELGSPADGVVAQDRRAFLGAATGVVVPPAMVMLLSTSLVSPAIAASGHGGGGGETFIPLAIPLIGGAAPPTVAVLPTPAGAPALAAAPVSGGSFASPAATVVTTPELGMGGGPARPQTVTERAPAIGRGAAPTRRALAIRKAGERG
jgi:hypothetical protein